MEKRLTMFLACLFLSLGMALAQTQFSGTVVSAEDGQPIIGASIKVVGTKTGTVTNIDGDFSLSAAAGAKLEISYIGMKSKTVTAKANMKIALEADNHSLDEVMVVAFGTQKRSAFTGSAAVVGSEELQKAQVTSVTNALAGAVPGIQLTSSDGAPGSSSKIRIRGFSSLNAEQDPLIIVDGAPYSGDLSNLNPNDVESMTVLKDASAAALYGARGANGVIMITTKNAKSGSKITFDAKYGWNTRALQHYETVNDPAQYYEMHYGALRDYYLANGKTADEAWTLANKYLTSSKNGGLGYNIWTCPDGETLIGKDGKMNPNATLGYKVSYKGQDFLITPDDWESVGTRTGIRQEYNLSMSGAGEKGHFYTSLGYLSNEGITEASDLKRFTGRLRADYQMRDWLKVGANMSYAHFNANSLDDNGSSSSTGNIWAFTSQMAPIYPAYIRNADGTVMIDKNGIGMMDYGDGVNAGMARPFIYNANPILDTRLNTRNKEGNASTGSAFADINIFDGLKLTLNGTYNLDEERSNNVYNPYYGQFDSTGGTTEMSHKRTLDVDLQQILNYSTTIADHHNLTAMLGHEYYKNRVYYLFAAKSQMFSQENKELNGAVVDGKSATSYKKTYNNEGYFGRVLYDYDGKYYAEASYRRDATSRFSPDYRWGSFWSLSGSWVLSKENWFKSSWIDMLKLKASVGSQGNDRIGDYRFTDLYNIINSSGKVGTSFKSKGTKDITWETNTNFNIGAEFELFKKLSGSLEYYYRKTTDMLFEFSVAPSIGYANYYANVGDLYNTGVELTLNYNVLRTKNVNWDIRFNAATLKNELTKLDADKKIATTFDADGNAYQGYTSGNFFITEGKSLYTWRMKDYAGVNEEGLPMWYKNKYETDAQGNRVQENGHDKVIGRETTTTYADADYYVMNSSTMPKVYGGLGTTVSAYGFDFSINCSFSLGGKQYDDTYAQFMTPPTSSSCGYNYHKDLLKAWTPTNTNTDIPRFVYGDLYSASTSSRFLTNASYLNIENLNFGYTLPRSLTSKFAIDMLRFYVSAENLCYISARKGFDPRQSYDKITNATNYSPMRTVSLGVTVQF